MSSTSDLSNIDKEAVEAIALLGDKSSTKRRSGAKRLRKLKIASAGAILLSALENEVQDPRTWETQYQMIMALGECSYTPALPFLEELAMRRFEATMVYVALGDAIVRLGRAHEDDPDPILRLMETGNPMLIEGAFRAVAMLRLRLNEAAVGKIVRYVSNLSRHDSRRFWVAAAAPEWKSPEVVMFLQACAEGPREDTRRAAVAAQQGKFLRWNPL